jgi:ribonuclease HI
MNNINIETEMEFDDIDEVFNESPPLPFPFQLKKLKNISILSFNPGGLKSDFTMAKIKMIRKTANMINADVICLQHLNLEGNALSILSTHVKGYVWKTSRPSDPYGLGIGAKKHKDVSISDPTYGRNGTFMTVRTTIRNTEVQISCVYLSKTNATYINSLKRIPLHPFNIVAGDFNIEPHDSKMTNLLCALNKLNVKRIQNFTPTHGKNGIIDHIFVPEFIYDELCLPMVLPGNGLDHMMMCGIAGKKKDFTIKSYRIPDSIAGSKPFRDKVFNIIGAYSASSCDPLEYLQKLTSAAQDVFDMNLATIEEVNLFESSSLLRSRENIKKGKKDKFIEEKGKDLKHLPKSKKKKELLKLINNKLKELNEELSLPKGFLNDSVIRRKKFYKKNDFILSNGRGPLVKKKEIDKALYQTWSEVFSSNRTSNRRIFGRLLNDYLRKVVWNDVWLDLDLLESIVKAAKKSCAGPDGIPFIFFSSTFDTLKNFWIDLIFSMVNSPEKFQNDFFLSGKLFLIAKKEGIISTTDFRPITVCNVVYRIVMKYFAIILRRMLSDVISTSQRALLVGRNIDQCIHHISDNFHRCIQEGINGALLQTDFAKAFDYIDRVTIFKVCEHVEIPKFMLNIISIALHESSVDYNGKVFISKVGVRQGCPISPLLFILVSDIYVNYISSIRGVIAVGVYCDDMAVIVADANALKHVYLVIHDYELAVGAELNIKKCIILFLNAPFPLPVQWINVEIVFETRYLGIYLSSSNPRIMWDTLIRKIKERVKMVKREYHSRNLRISMINIYIFSILSYTLRFFIPPPWFCVAYFLALKPILGSMNGLTFSVFINNTFDASLSKNIFHPLLFSVALIASRPPSVGDCRISNSVSENREIALQLFASYTKQEISPLSSPQFYDLNTFYLWKEAIGGKRLSQNLYKQILVNFDGFIPTKLFNQLGDEFDTKIFAYNISIKCPNFLRENLVMIANKRGCFNSHLSYFTDVAPLCNLCKESRQSHSHIVFGCIIIERLFDRIRSKYTLSEGVNWPFTGLDRVCASEILSQKNYILRLILLRVFKSLSSSLASDGNPIVLGLSIAEALFNRYGRKYKILRSNYPIVRFSHEKDVGDVTLPPARNEVTGFFDGSARVDPHVIGFGGVLYHRNLIHVVGYRLAGGTITDAEIFGLEMILVKAASLGIKRITIYGDSEIIIKCCSELRWLLIPSVCAAWLRIKKLISKFEDVELIHIPRQLNKVADAIAFSVCISLDLFREVGDKIVRSIPFERPLGSVVVPDVENSPFFERYFVKRFRKPTFPVSSLFSLNSDVESSLIFDINRNV